MLPIGASHIYLCMAKLLVSFISPGTALSYLGYPRHQHSHQSERIASLPDSVMIWEIFPLKGWILLAIMMGLGITMKHIPDVPMSFTASFYSGLGPMLIVSSLRFAASVLHK